MFITDFASSPFLSTTASIQTGAVTASPTTMIDSTEQKLELENKFCRNFSCCGLELENLHELLEHYEEYHLTFEYDHDDNNIDFLFPPPQPQSLQPQQQITSTAIASEYSFKKSDNMLFDANSNTSLTKEHISNTDLTMLENANTLSFDKNVETVDSILESLSTPSLSPSTSIKSLDEDLISHSKPEEWYQKVNAMILESIAHEDQSDKPYKCHVVGCEKAYKNANGLKYHKLHGHCQSEDGSDLLDSSKPYTCSLGHCRKKYKNLNGLKYHIEHTHMAKINFDCGFLSLNSKSDISSALLPIVNKNRRRSSAL